MKREGGEKWERKIKKKEKRKESVNVKFKQWAKLTHQVILVASQAVARQFDIKGYVTKGQSNSLDKVQSEAEAINYIADSTDRPR